MHTAPRPAAVMEPSALKFPETGADMVVCYAVIGICGIYYCALIRHAHKKCIAKTMPCPDQKNANARVESCHR